MSNGFFIVLIVLLGLAVYLQLKARGKRPKAHPERHLIIRVRGEMFVWEEEDGDIRGDAGCLSTRLISHNEPVTVYRGGPPRPPLYEGVMTNERLFRGVLGSRTLVPFLYPKNFREGSEIWILMREGQTRHEYWGQMARD